MLEDLPGAQRLVVDRELIERSAPEQGAGVAGHQIQSGVGERALSGCDALLLEADGLPVYVWADLAGCGCARVDRDRVVVPDPCAWALEEDAVAISFAADPDAERSAELAGVGVDQEAARILVEVRSELHR